MEGGETKKRSVGMPFLIRGGSRKIGVVLIHGYMVAPLEVQKLAFQLGSRGIWVYVPRLRGHGTSPEDLARTRFQDWVDSVDLGYGVISNICKKVVAGGFSTGGALALVLAARVKDVDRRGAKRVFELLGSQDKQLIMFNFDRHGILLGEGAQQAGASGCGGFCGVFEVGV